MSGQGRPRCRSADDIDKKKNATTLAPPGRAKCDRRLTCMCVATRWLGPPVVMRPVGPAHRMSAANLPDQIAESEPLSSMRQLLRNASLSLRPMSAFIINPHSSLPFFAQCSIKWDKLSSRPYSAVKTLIVLSFKSTSIRTKDTSLAVFLNRCFQLHFRDHVVWHSYSVVEVTFLFSTLKLTFLHYFLYCITLLHSVSKSKGAWT